MYFQTVLLLFSFYLRGTLTYKTDIFTEEVIIKPLYSEQLYIHFQFSTIWHTFPHTESFYHTHLVPRALGEIISRHDVDELNVVLTNGLWRYEQWGYPVIDAAPGGEIWAWFRNGTADVDRKWKELASSLSGLLCASLNFVAPATSITPEFSFRRRGVSKTTPDSRYLRYSSLPREIVCTENLTPWKKMLPCGTYAGLASLLNAGQIHNTRYHSLALSVRPICRDADCTSISFELKQSISLVYDYLILGTKNWSFINLFGQGLMGPCSLATSSTIYVDVTSNASVPFQLNPEPDEYVTSYRGGQMNVFAKYKVKSQPSSVGAVHKSNQVLSVNSPPALYANQYVKGYGHEKGGIVTKIYNNHWSELDVVVLQNIPWYVPVYLHTLEIYSNGKKNSPIHLSYTPGRQRQKPYRIEILLRLPPRSTTSISIDFDYIFLKWQEYPPDANHGFYVGSAIISAFLPLAKNFTGLPQDGTLFSDSFNASRSGYLIQIRTENLVITLPTPDFSMPYNVICLACTVVALAFGPLHNMTTKRLVLKSKEKGKLAKKIESVLQTIFKKKSEEEKQSE